MEQQRKLAKQSPGAAFMVTSAQAMLAFVESNSAWLAIGGEGSEDETS